MAWFYYNTDPEALDAPAVTAGGTALAVNGYEWNAPVMGGVLFKKRVRAPPRWKTQDLGTWEQASLDITLPADRPTHLVVKEASGNVLLDVNNEAQVTVAFPANGKYTLEADVTVPRHSSADKTRRARPRIRRRAGLRPRGRAGAMIRGAAAESVPDAQGRPYVPIGGPGASPHPLPRKRAMRGFP